MIILAIFLFGLQKTPTLRYGGYSIVFLTLSIPTALIYQKLKNKDFFEKKLKYLIILIIVLFNLKILIELIKSLSEQIYTNLIIFLYDSEKIYFEFPSDYNL